MTLNNTIALQYGLEVVQSLTDDELGNMAKYGAEVLVRDSGGCGLIQSSLEGAPLLISYQPRPVMTKWMTDCFGKYDQRADVYVAFQRAWIALTLHHGVLLTNEKRTAYVTMSTPATTSFFHGKDLSNPLISRQLEKFFSLGIDRSEFFKRQAEYEQIAQDFWGAQYWEVYKVVGLAVQPSLQHQGLGNAFHQCLRNMPLIFVAGAHLIGMYAHWGASVVGEFTLEAASTGEKRRIRWLSRDVPLHRQSKL